MENSLDERFTHEEYVEWCKEKGLYTPTKCEKCGGSFHYICVICNHDYFKKSDVEL